MTGSGHSRRYQPWPEVHACPQLPRKRTSIQGLPDPSRAQGAASRRLGDSRPAPWAYLTRLQTASAFVPVVVAGFVYFSSSAVREVMMRFCSPPLRFGYELASTRKV